MTLGVILVVVLMLPRSGSEMVGTWIMTSHNEFDGPRILHLNPDRTYWHESGLRRYAGSGRWSSMAFYDGPGLVLDRFYRGTDTVVDGKFAYSRQTHSLENIVIGGNAYTFVSNDPVPRLTQGEKRVVGSWLHRNNDDYVRISFFSNHQLFYDHFVCGTWEIQDKTIRLKWDKDTDDNPRFSTMTIPVGEDALKSSDGKSWLRNADGR